MYIVFLCTSASASTCKSTYTHTFTCTFTYLNDGTAKVNRIKDSEFYHIFYSASRVCTLCAFACVVCVCVCACVCFVYKCVCAHA